MPDKDWRDEYVDNTKKVLEMALALHTPRRDVPYSLVTWEYRSCGAYEPYMADDGMMAVGPVKYPCKVAQSLTSALELLKTEETP